MGFRRKNKIGLFGGTFNPIHLGHLVIAEYARCSFGLSQVIFIPAKQPPHKDNQDIAPAEHRFNMVKIAINSNPYFTVSREEIDRPGPSYSVDTLESFRNKEGGGQEINFIIGADAILDIPTWRESDKVMELCSFLAATRPGYSLDLLKKQIKGLSQRYQERIVLFEIPRIDISSTCIREFIKQGRSIKYLVPEPVEKYIFEHNLYL